jgi:hypothetical protein
MLKWLKSLLGVPQPAGPPETLRRFRTADSTVSPDGIRVAEDGWVVEAADNRTIRPFEVADLELEKCLLTYRARMKAEGLSGRAFLEMWCRLPGRGEFFSRGLGQALTATIDWSSYDIPFYLKRGQRPDLVKLNLVVEGRGKVWIKDIELLRTPLHS